MRSRFSLQARSPARSQRAKTLAIASSSNDARCSVRKSGVARFDARGSKGANTGKARLCAAISASRGRSTSIPRMYRQSPRGCRSKNARRSFAVSALPVEERVAAFHGCASMKRDAVVLVTASLTRVLRWMLIGTAPHAAGAIEEGVFACASAW